MQYASMCLLLACSHLEWAQKNSVVALPEFVLVPVYAAIHLRVTCCHKKVTVNAHRHANFSTLLL